MAAKQPEDLPGAVRRKVRDVMASTHLLERMVKDIHFLFAKDGDEGEDGPDIDVTYLWDGGDRTVKNGISYRDTWESEPW